MKTPSPTYLDYASSHFHIQCQYCINLLPDEPIIRDENWNNVQFPHFISEFTWIEANKVKIKKWSAYQVIQANYRTITQVSPQEIKITFYWKCASICADLMLRENIEESGNSFTFIPYVWVARSNPIVRTHMCYLIIKTYF